MNITTTATEITVHLTDLTPNDLFQRVGWLVAGFGTTLEGAHVTFIGQAQDTNGDLVEYYEEDEARITMHARYFLEVRTRWDEQGDPPARIHIFDVHRFEAIVRIPINIPIAEVPANVG